MSLRQELSICIDGRNNLLEWKYAGIQKADGHKHRDFDVYACFCAGRDQHCQTSLSRLVYLHPTEILVSRLWVGWIALRETLPLLYNNHMGNIYFPTCCVYVAKCCHYTVSWCRGLLFRNVLGYTNFWELLVAVSAMCQPCQSRGGGVVHWHIFNTRKQILSRSPFPSVLLVRLWNCPYHYCCTILLLVSLFGPCFPWCQHNLSAIFVDKTLLMLYSE